MDKIISLIIFTLPGLMTYILAQLFGATPSYKRKGNEMLLVSFFLWIPIVIIIILLYQGMAGLTHISILHPEIDIPLIKKNWIYFEEMSDLTKLANKPLFIFYYFLMSIVLSLFIAKFIYGKVFDYLRDKVNKEREANGVAPISRDTSTWEKAFSNNEAQIVKLTNLSTMECEIGELESVSGSLDNEKDFLLRHTEHWRKIMDAYEVKIEKVYIDIKTGYKIEIYKKGPCVEAQDLYLIDME